MRWMIYGAGAVGGVVAARLAIAGHDVAVVARGPHLEAIQKDGLTLRRPDGDTVVKVDVYRHPADTEQDVVVLAMKGQDTGAALVALEGFRGPVVCLQNGVANERAALRHFADVYGVHVILPASHLEPGVVVEHCDPVPGILDLGRYPSGSDATALRLAQGLEEAGFVSQPRADIMRWKHRKLVLNLGNAVEALCGRVDGLDAAVGPVQAEGEEVLRRAGIDVASAAEDRERRGDIMRWPQGINRAGGSSWQSLARGAGTVEADYLNGEIVLLGRLHGVPTPANETARRLVQRAVREGRTPGSLTPAEFLEAVTLSTTRP
ncbi:ketopantoate reductase family protein [Dactylosporangium siamense]|uniref:2-dehydropantoate 2-reductase n=1 Tax=Dactylosporangium siamense TaxID=685454 RepID=A0A919UAM6_9ACTN|nr:2-dehydropantoate 2-reductase N-terminal domain-containing protein [Dactylosporangium siamense]GIG44860.1 2-dehydropantoate 2-reductase [Dactylosporangium siamense]